MAKVQRIAALGAMRAHSATAVRHADPDLAAQIALLRQMIGRNAQLLDRLLAEPSPCSTSDDSAGTWCIFDAAQLQKELERAKKSNETICVAELQQANKLGHMRTVMRAPQTAAFADLRRDFPHFAEVVDLLKQRAALAMVSQGQAYALPPVLLDGPPGVGKTAFVSAVARVLGAPFQFVDVGSATAGFALAGNHRSWSGAQPGSVWRLLQSPSGSGVLLLDEIDTAADSKYPVLGPLYNLLEPSTARQFTDEFIELPIDASRIFWFGTCNDSSLLDSALRSRFVEFRIAPPSAAQMSAVAASVYATLRSRSPWGEAYPRLLPPEVAEVLVAFTPRELVRVLEDAVARAAEAGRRHLVRGDVAAVPAAKHQKRRAPIGFI